MDLTDLPDDVLLEILGYSEARELIRLRVVCRRFRDLALDVSLWKHREIRSWEAKVGFFKAVVALAPCLRSLDLHWDWLQCVDTLIESPCAVVNLALLVPKGTGPKAAHVLRRQAEHGSLRRLHIRFQHEKGFDGDGKNDGHCIGTILGCDLLDLKVVNVFSFPLPAIRSDAVLPVVEGGGGGSVKKLTYCSAFADGLLESILTARGAGMESIHLQGELALFTAVHMARCTNLRELSCPLLSGMDSLVRSHSLLTLELETNLEEVPDLMVTSLVQYLIQASQLTSVTLKFPTVPPVRDAVSALAATSCSQLRTLRIKCRGLERRRTASLPWLAIALPRLSHLSVLEVGPNPPATFFMEITPRSAPSLRVLDINEQMRDIYLLDPLPPCYLPDIINMLRRNRYLHVVGVQLWHRCLSKENCECCQRQYHERISEMRTGWHEHCALYLHPVTDESCEWHVDGYSWLAVHSLAADRNDE